MECKPDKHKPRDNKMGITWCIRCGRLFTKPCGRDLKESEILIINKNNKNETDTSVKNNNNIINS